MTTKIVLPKYLATQPSTGEKIEFRPFTVKEEKSLLLALQENNMETVAMAIKNLVSVCTEGAIDPKNVPYYDIEYIYLQIRAKSVGELIDLIGTCDCGPNSTTDFDTNIEDIKIEPKPFKSIPIQIPDTNYSIEFRHPTIDDFVVSFTKGVDATEKVIANCILSVYTDDEVMEWSMKEKTEFVESMTSKQQKELAAFLKNMPMVKLPANYKCRHCGKTHERTISGFESFFV